MLRSMLAFAGSISLILSIAASAPACAATKWAAAWTAPPDQAGPPLGAVTIRQIVRVGLAGSAVRIRLSNLYGDRPLKIGPVRVARTSGDKATQTGADRLATFGGSSNLVLAAGAEGVSDPIALDVAALEDITVSLHLPEGSATPTLHGVGLATAFKAAGDATAAMRFPTGDTDDSRYFVTELDVATDEQARLLVVVGDSISDGVGSTRDANRRWPDALLRRLQADPKLRSVAVVNSGIAGNRLLRDAVAPFVGTSALSRFDRDALHVPGAHWILLLHGVNDLSAANLLRSKSEDASADQIIGGFRALIARAHAKGLRIWGATLLPDEGVRGGFWSGAGEAKRLAVNDWIRSSGAFDAVIDFDRVVRDPDHPSRLLPRFDSGDHLHPNDAGYAAMATAIDLRMFDPEHRQGRRRASDRADADRGR